MGCNPVNQSCPPGSTTPPADGEPIESLPETAAEPSLPPESSAFISTPRADEALGALSSSASPSNGAVEATRAFLDRWSVSHPVAAGVRYPLLSENLLDVVTYRKPSLRPPSTVTSFGRHQPAILALQDWVRTNRPEGPFRALVVGAGLASI